MQTVFIAVRLDFIGCFNGLIFCSVLVSDDEIKKINKKKINLFDTAAIVWYHLSGNFSLQKICT